MKQIADIHCHILPYVDDGAENIEEATVMLDKQAEQGVRTICATPHLRAGMFEISDDDIRTQFERLKEIEDLGQKNIQFVLGREYYCDKHFLELLEQGEVIPLGNGSTLLVEFSNRFSLETICERIRIVRNHGYVPLVAHVERYAAIDRHAEGVRKLINEGALIQINAGSILGREGIWQKRFCYKLMKDDLVHVVASDAHGYKFRPPELQLCANYIEKKLGASYANKVLWMTPVNILKLL